MRIEYLADQPSHIPTLAAWHHAEFGYLTPAVLLMKRVEQLTASAQKGSLPLSFVALDEDRLIGSASLLPYTITHRHLSPLLANVYVPPEYRKQGIASALIGRVLQEAASMGMETVYLLTPDREEFYTRLGWTLIEYFEHRGYRYSVMSIRSMNQA